MSASSQPRRPLSALRSAIEEGASTTAELQRRTGLSRSVVEAGLAQLERMNLLHRSLQVSACSTSHSCATCRDQGSCEDPSAIGQRGGVVTLRLIPRPDENS